MKQVNLNNDSQMASASSQSGSLIMWMLRGCLVVVVVGLAVLLVEILPYYLLPVIDATGQAQEGFEFGLARVLIASGLLGLVVIVISAVLTVGEVQPGKLVPFCWITLATVIAGNALSEFSGYLTRSNFLQDSSIAILTIGPTVGMLRGLLIVWGQARYFKRRSGVVRLWFIATVVAWTLPQTAVSAFLAAFLLGPGVWQQ